MPAEVMVEQRAKTAGLHVWRAGRDRLDGTTLSLIWTLPFIGLLLSIALFPLIAPRFWEHHFGKIATLWALAFLMPCAGVFGLGLGTVEVLHALLSDYLPFIIMLFSLFVIAGGIRIAGNLVGTPVTNTVMLSIGTLLASLLGTTGASMLLIRPLISANADRRHRAHVFVFFIFLVANIGGSLTPLGDLPLFLGFLNGIDFLWTLRALYPLMLTASAILLGLFYAIDLYAWRKERPRHAAAGKRRLRIHGSHNVIYLALVAAAVFGTGVWQNDRAVPIGLGIALPLKGLVRDLLLLTLSILSWKTTPKSIRIENAFTWTPIQEVAMLFAGIFVTMAPALAILRAGADGALAPLLKVISTEDGRPIDTAYFWLTGILSSFLDNAPTYLVFFNLAGGDPRLLMGPLASTLLAISAGAVFMGANTYIGNAPNFMVKSICEEHGIKMPGFFGYMMWSGGILLPLFALMTWLFLS